MWLHASTVLLSLTIAQSQLLLDPDLPDPRIVITGPTGSGKSSMANALLGCDPQSSECMFHVCDGMDSCTKETSYGKGQWLGKGPNFTVVDTPGFGDSDGEDGALIEEMLEVLKETIKHSSTILLVLKGTETRFNDGLQSMLRQMTTIFGEQWWDYTVIGVSFWKLDQDSIDEREGICEHYPDKCKNEEWFIREINSQLQEKFQVHKNLTYAFIDSYSQAWPNNEDPIQQQHFDEETEILWTETTTRNETIFFKGIDDVLEENAAMKEKIKWLEDTITNNISQLITRMEANEENDKLQDQTITNVNQDLHNELGDVTEELHNELRNVTDVLRNELHSLSSAPVGTIITWVNKPTTDSSSFVDVPDGWLKCDGSTIPHPSIWAGQIIPDLNGEKRFLRGGTDSDVLKLEEDTTRMIEHTHIDNGHSHTATSSASPHSHGYSDRWFRDKAGMNYDWGNNWSNDYHYDSKTTSSATVSVTTTISSRTSGLKGVKSLGEYEQETRPKNMNVIFIMKIW